MNNISVLSSCWHVSLHLFRSSPCRCRTDPSTQVHHLQLNWNKESKIITLEEKRAEHTMTWTYNVTLRYPLRYPLSIGINPPCHHTRLTLQLCWSGHRGNAWPRYTGTLSRRNVSQRDHLLTCNEMLNVFLWGWVSSQMMIKMCFQKGTLSTVFSQSLWAVAPIPLHSWRTFFFFSWNVP